jgi:hypothetical protein
MIKYVVCSIICLIFLGSCGDGTVGEDKNEQPLAQAAGNYLYPSTIAGIGTGMTKKDSLYQLKVYTEQWVRDQLMLDVANNNVTVTTQIERMVQAYEATLIMNEYEEALINQRLNTEVTPQELANYYSNNKEQYQAGISWVRCHFVKVKRGTPELQQLKKWFKSDAGVDFERVKLFCAKQKTVHILNEDLWIEYDKLVKEFPKDAIGSRHREKQAILDRMDENYQYLLQIFEYRDKEDAAPLSQVQDEIKRIVLHQRRNKILQDLRKEVYEKAKKEGTFEIY